METPRTEEARIDNADLADWGTGKSEYVRADFARGLERELVSSNQIREAEKKILLQEIEAHAKTKADAERLAKALNHMMGTHCMHGPCRSNGCADCRHAYEKSREALAAHKANRGNA